MHDDDDDGDEEDEDEVVVDARARWWRARASGGARRERRARGDRVTTMERRFSKSASSHAHAWRFLGGDDDGAGGATCVAERWTRWKSARERR